MTSSLLQRESFIELDARARALALLDAHSARELLDPFDRIKSPWLPRQGIVAQADDGVVVFKGRIDGRPAVVLAIDGAYQGGSMGEVGGAKIAAALELAVEDNRRGVPTCAVLLLETGGVRLQEANLGLAAIADIHAAMIELRRHQPVVGIIAGPVGCYGGMGIAAGLCSYLIVTREARLGLNGPAVIEQEAGIDELDSHDKPFIWSLTGGEQRHAQGLADEFAADDVVQVRERLLGCLRRGLPSIHRSQQCSGFVHMLAGIEPVPVPEPAEMRSMVRAARGAAPARSGAAAPSASQRSPSSPGRETRGSAADAVGQAIARGRARDPVSGHETEHGEGEPAVRTTGQPFEQASRQAMEQAASRGAAWLGGLTDNAPALAGFPATVRIVDAPLGNEQARYIAVVPDEANRFPRVRNGEMGLEEGWHLARAIRQWCERDLTGAGRASGGATPVDTGGGATAVGVGKDAMAMSAGEGPTAGGGAGKSATDAALRPIVAVLDVPSQAYGRLEEGLGLHQALAAVVDAAAQARLAGHPFIGLIVGKAISGGFLALGCQANRLIALRDPGVQVHAMGKASAARITQRTVEQLETLAAAVPPMAYDIDSYAGLGMLWQTMQARNADQPTVEDLAAARVLLCEAVADIRADARRDLSSRLGAENRSASSRVRERMRELWGE
ncbi:biotin-independent malonate decarboxylase beta subunit/biotin-independent malonate decarboxylase gamma subunit,TIGR03134 [Pusillimonas noertemannii]|uniref:Biotin-independent malonate decarboxylase beta subunit/biotin-independent malonate decarboxylase gamma subunit,TIGR03134 n=2 Tax=Pusillimonas noertemannii TaxID=305977 RepID=A0A2U1CPA5_9BURK|nr:biotin-independent malonate decarboxylase subunit beta [Pusillimonas noertemannii]PVY67722.1 biotin-independent malonate decarboxylase beta subunit/biotin-independent malonate decarboxylase gamma subunit,TIGR03134 [Pusillimonas noertemannii]TFL12743.1 biotin-independent malonate decarboxylase subunit beta [Pusillimonas noertemannii]